MDFVNEEDEIDKEEADDIIDTAMSKLVDELLKGSSDETDLDAASDLLFDVIADLVDDEKIEDLPAEDSSDEDKQKWIDTYLAVVQGELNKAWNDEETGEVSDGDGDLA